MAIVDKEFGEIKIRKNKLARSVKLSVGVDGSLRASIPYYSSQAWRFLFYACFLYSSV